MTGDFVLAALNPPSLWNFYETLEAARADNERANRESSQRRDYQPMTWNQYKEHQRTFFLSDDPVQITKEQYTYAFEVLPPTHWQTLFRFESFLALEHYSGVYTNQYAKRGTGETATYWTRMVDSSDRSTWMQP